MGLVHFFFFFVRFCVSYIFNFGILGSRRGGGFSMGCGGLGGGGRGGERRTHRVKEGSQLVLGLAPGGFLRLVGEINCW